MVSNIIKYSGVIISLLLLIAGGTTYFVTIDEDSIKVKFNDSNSDCSVLELTINKDSTNKLKCGRYIIAEWDSILLHENVGYIDSAFERDNRKTSKTNLFIVNSTPEYFIVRKVTEYYKGYSGSDGVVTEDYKFSKNGLKWSYKFDSVNDLKHYVVLRVDKYRPKYGYLFNHNDPLNNYKFNKDEEYYYGGVSGDLLIDPEIKKIPLTAISIRDEVYLDKKYENHSYLDFEIVYENFTYENGSEGQIYSKINTTKYKLIDTGKSEIYYNNVAFIDKDINFDCDVIKDNIVCKSLLDLDTSFEITDKDFILNTFEGHIKETLKTEGII